MEFESLVKIAGQLPVLDTEILRAGVDNAKSLKVQISRWCKAGKLIQLRRGLYLLGETYRKIEIFEPYIATVLVAPSYLSLEKALEYYGLIPEGVSVFTSVTTKRPGEFETKIGRFNYQHIQKDFFWGYQSVNANHQTAYIALPEKAVLDFIYFHSGEMTTDYIEELRLQNLGGLSTAKLLKFAKRFGKKKVIRSARRICDYVVSERKKEKKL